MNSYVIKVINKGREKDFFDYWRRQRSTNAAGDPLDPELLGFEVRQNGSTVEQAIAAVRRKHPGLQIDIESISASEAS